MWFRRQRSRLPSANASREQLARLVDGQEVLLVGRLLVGVAPARSSSRRPRSSSFRKSSTSRTVFGVVVVKNVVLVVTRKPRCLASRIASTHSSKTPVSHDRLVVALAQPVDVHDPREVRRRLRRGRACGASAGRSCTGRRTSCARSAPRTITWISGWISGSPPGDRHHRRARLLDRRACASSTRHALLQDVRSGTGSCRSPRTRGCRGRAARARRRAGTCSFAAQLLLHQIACRRVRHLAERDGHQSQSALSAALGARSVESAPVARRPRAAKRCAARAIPFDEDARVGRARAPGPSRRRRAAPRSGARRPPRGEPGGLHVDRERAASRRAPRASRPSASRSTQSDRPDVHARGRARSSARASGFARLGSDDRRAVARAARRRTTTSPGHEPRVERAADAGDGDRARRGLAGERARPRRCARRGPMPVRSDRARRAAPRAARAPRSQSGAHDDERLGRSRRASAARSARAPSPGRRAGRGGS